MLARSFRTIKPRFSNFQKRFVEEAADPPLGESLWLQDIKRHNLLAISSQLGSKYLAETSQPASFPVKGLIYSKKNGRRFVNLIVSFQSKRIVVPFVIDSGSPVITLSKETIEALCVDFLPSELYVDIHGYGNIPVTHDFANEKLRDINILGWRFFDETPVVEVIDKKNMSVTLYNNVDPEQINRFIEETGNKRRK